MHVVSGPLENRQVAWSDLDALVARFNFTREELSQERASWKDGTPFSDILRSVVHERMHLSQATCTTWGIFCWRLRDVQTMVIKDIIQALRIEKTPIRPPIRLQLRELKVGKGSPIGDLALLWLAIETFLVREEGTWENASALFDEAARAGIHGQARTFATMQAAIAHNYQLHMTAAIKSGAGGVRSGTNPDPRALNEERAADQSIFLKKELLADVMKIVVNDSATSVSILESSALAGELYYSSSADVKRVLETSLDNERFPYLEPLTLTAHALGPVPPEDLLYSHIVCCELALMSPILPHLWRLRHGLDLTELLPRLRFIEILGVLKHVSPGGIPQGLAGHSHAVNAIFDALGWASPMKIATLWDSPARPPVEIDIRDYVFDRAMEVRRIFPPLFCLPQLSVAGPEPLVKMAMQFDFPIIQWSDTVSYTRDKNMLFSFRSDYVWYRWLRQLYLGLDKPLTVPWKADQAELESLSDLAQDLMATALDWEQAPRPTFRALD